MRAYNCLKRSGITKVGQMLTMTEEDLLAVRNFGEKSLNELKDSLKERGLLPSSAQLERFEREQPRTARTAMTIWMRTTTTHSAYAPS